MSASGPPWLRVTVYFVLLLSAGRHGGRPALDRHTRMIHVTHATLHWRNRLVALA